MIKSISVTNYANETLVMDLRRPEKSGFLVTNIEGLGPCKADINSTELANYDGSIFNSARMNSRNIVISLEFMYEFGIEKLRHDTYRYFPIKKPLRLRIETDKRVCETIGYVESNEPNIFSSNEGTQISIICPDSYFYSPSFATTVFSGIEPIFEFPFEFEGKNGTKEFGYVSTTETENVLYDGDGNPGIIIYMTATGSVGDVSIFNVDTRGKIFIDSQKLLKYTGSSLKASDEVVISTVKGNKRAFLVRNGETTNIINCLNRDLEWFELVKGDNLFTYTTSTTQANLKFRIENRKLYEGV